MFTCLFLIATYVNNKVLQCFIVLFVVKFVDRGWRFQEVIRDTHRSVLTAMLIVLDHFIICYHKQIKETKLHHAMTLYSRL